MNMPAPPNCLICGSLAPRKLCTSNGHEIHRCSLCCSDFVWPQPDDREIKAYYDQASYFQGVGSGSYANYDLDTEAVLPLFRELLQNISSGSQSSILDIGCAYGTHLAIAIEQGWEAVGVELSDHARQVAAQRLGAKATIFESVEEVPSRAFDVVTLFDVLEHLTRPYELFETLFRFGLIGEKTVVILTTPNARSSHAVADLTGWPYRHPPAHLVYYSAQSLRTFWAQMGVRDVEVRGVYGQDQLEPAAYSDEESGLNLSLQSFAGLLCIARGFGTSIQLLNQMLAVSIEAGMRSIIEQQGGSTASSLRQPASAHAAVVEQATAHLRRMNVDLIAAESSRGWAEHLLVLEKKKAQQMQILTQHMQDLLTEESAKLQVATIEMQTLQQTKWFRLRSVLAARPITLRSIASTAYLTASMMLPKPVRSVVRRMVSWPSGATFQTASNVKPYVVREPILTLSPRLRVVHVIANFMTGGSSRLVVDLIEKLGQHYEQSVITSFVPNPPAYVGLKISELRSPRDSHTFVQHFLQAKPVLIHVHYWGEVDESWYAMAISAAETLGIPVVENVNTPVKPHFAAIVKRYVYVSDYVRKAFGRSGQTHTTIYPGSDFSHFSHNILEEASDCVGMVYRLERDKLREDAMLPFIVAVKKRPQTRILVVGGGELLSVFQRAVKKAGVEDNFEFTGYVSYSDLPDIYRRMSIFVAPVWKESFGQVSAFAMNMGIPVCGYDIGAIGEIVEDRSLVVPEGDAKALANVIIRLLESPQERKRIGQQHHLRAQACFSVEAMAKAYSSLYSELTGIPA